MRLSRLLLSCFGLGELPVMPGTWGTAGAAAVAALLLAFVPAVGDRWLEVCAAWVVAASLLTVLLTPDVEKSTGGKDPQVVVMDEVAGYWTTLALVPSPDYTHLVAAFFVFRFFDVVKVWPGRALENLPHGWGVLLDDLMAGAYGAVVLWGVEALARHA